MNRDLSGRVRLAVITLACLWAALLTFAQGPVTDFKPVTNEVLRHPDPADWIHWRRTLDGWGYSPLNQIIRDNVGRLQLAWSWAMQPGADEATPLVYHGIMYLPSPSGIQALDAATGDLLWEDKRPGVARRNLAIYGDKILAATAEAHLIALDARAGTLVWDQTVANSTLGYKYSSEPIVVQGKVIAGMTGCERYKDDVCFISAHDAETGKELWWTSTIARPWEPGGDTWGDLPLTFRAGADAWLPGIRCEDKLDLLGDGASQAVDERPARHRRCGVVHEQHLGARSRHGQDRLVLSAHSPRRPRHGRGVRKHSRRYRRATGARHSLFKMGKDPPLRRYRGWREKAEPAGRSESPSRIPPAQRIWASSSPWIAERAGCCGGTAIPCPTTRPRSRPLAGWRLWAISIVISRPSMW